MREYIYCFVSCFDVVNFLLGEGGPFPGIITESYSTDEKKWLTFKPHPVASSRLKFVMINHIIYLIDRTNCHYHFLVN